MLTLKMVRQKKCTAAMKAIMLGSRNDMVSVNSWNVSMLRMKRKAVRLSPMYEMSRVDWFRLMPLSLRMLILIQHTR